MDNRMAVRVSDDVPEGVACVDRYLVEEPRTPGWILVRRAYYDRSQAIRLSASLAHELAHAVWQTGQVGRAYEAGRVLR